MRARHDDSEDGMIRKDTAFVNFPLIRRAV